jgi:16S rRNA (uracil1498-N3)-methyltransferase
MITGDESWTESAPSGWARLQRLAIAPGQRDQEWVDLTPEQQHYLLRVLRLRSGDRFLILDREERWLAQLQPQITQAKLLTLAPSLGELPFSVTLLAALPKGNGFEQVVQQATELGVNTVIPLLSQRTLLQPSPHKLERWRRIAQESAEQSQRQRVPTLLDPVDFSQGIAAISNAAARYLCGLDPTAPHLWNCLSSADGGEIALATGPEGGWTPAEVEEAIAGGWQPVSLGARTLRAITAPLVGLTLVAARLELGMKESG